MPTAAEASKTIAFKVFNRWTGALQFTAEIECADDALPNIKVGLAVKWAFKSGAVLSGADLRGAVLRDAVLRGADLSGADLSGADLSDAVLSGADLRGAVLSGAVLSPLQAAQLSIVPEEGDYTAWKKCSGGVIVKLLIPAAAKRSNATGRKCRAEFAHVLEIVGGTEFATSSHDHSVRYVVGETVRCHEWDADRWAECSGGIHHFITRAEAEAY